MSTDIESAFLEIGRRVKRTLGEIPAPRGKVYACGFWLFYCDHTVLGAPCFAYNVVGNEKDSKWAPPEWIVDVDDRMIEAINPLYQELSASMKGQDHDAWESLMDCQWRFFSQLCRSITQDARSLLGHWQTTNDFLCGIFEERESAEIYTALIRSSVGEETAKRLGILES